MRKNVIFFQIIPGGHHSDPLTPLTTSEPTKNVDLVWEIIIYYAAEYRSIGGKFYNSNEFNFIDPWGVTSVFAWSKFKNPSTE